MEHSLFFVFDFGNVLGGDFRNAFGDDFGRLLGDFRVRVLRNPRFLDVVFPIHARNGRVCGDNREAKNFPCAVQRGIDIRENVLFADFLEKSRLGKRDDRLGMDARKKQRRAFGATFRKQPLDHLDSRGIDRRDLPHPENQNPRVRTRHVERGLEFFDSAKEKRTHDFKNGDTMRNVTTRDVVRVRKLLVVLAKLFGHIFHFRHIRHSADEKDCGQKNAHLDGDGQIHDNGQNERREKNGHVALRRALDELREILVAAHVERDLEKDRGERRHRNHFGVLAEQKHDQKQHHRMDQARNRTRRAVPDVRRRARDRPRRRDSAENRGKDVGDSLPHEFRIRTVPRSRHTVGDNRGEERFDGPENRNRERGLKHLAHHFKADIRQMRQRKSRRDMVLGANRRHADVRSVPPQNLDERGREDDGNQGAGNLRRHLGPKNAYEKSENTHDDRMEIRRSNRLRVQGDFPDGVGGFGNSRGEMQTQKIRNLSERNDDGDSGGKPHGHRERDEFDDRSELRHAENDEHDAREKRRRGESVITVFGDDAVDDDDEGSRRTADLKTAPAEKGNGEPRDNRRVKPLFGTDAARDGESDGKRKRKYSDDEPGHQILGEKLFRITLAQLLEKLWLEHVNLWHKCRQR